MDDIGNYPIESLGEALFRQGGDIFCELPLISCERTEDGTSGSVVYEYDPYIITVTYDIEGNKRKNPHWVRTYKEEST